MAPQYAAAGPSGYRGWHRDSTSDLLISVTHPHNAYHFSKKPVTTMLTYPWKCTVLHCNHLGNTWKPLVLMTWHFDYCPSASEGDNQSVRSSAPVVSRCFPGGYNVKLYISRGRLAWWLLAFLCCVQLNETQWTCDIVPCFTVLFVNPYGSYFGLLSVSQRPFILLLFTLYQPYYPSSIFTNIYYWAKKPLSTS